MHQLCSLFLQIDQSVSTTEVGHLIEFANPWLGWLFGVFIWEKAKFSILGVEVRNVFPATHCSWAGCCISSKCSTFILTPLLFFLPFKMKMWRRKHAAASSRWWFQSWATTALWRRPEFARITEIKVPQETQIRVVNNYKHRDNKLSLSEFPAPGVEIWPGEFQQWAFCHFCSIQLRCVQLGGWEDTVE